MTGEGEPERTLAGNVSASFFNVLGVKLAMGRNFLPEEEQRGRNQVVILNHSLWQRRFNSDPQIIGKKITLGGMPYEVIGVLPPSFWFPNQDLALWYPLDFTTPGMQVRYNHFLNVFARLRPGVTLEQARAEMDRIGAQLQQEYPEANQYHSAYVIPLREQLVGEVRRALYILLTAVGLVLLIACANVANLLLARAATRQREVAIRTALGASRTRLVRQFLTESLLLALLGGGIGTLLALWGVDLLTWAMPQDSIPRLSEAGLDGRVLGYTLAISLLTGVLFGLVPALQASKPNFNETLKEGGRSSGVAAACAEYARGGRDRAGSGAPGRGWIDDAQFLEADGCRSRLRGQNVLTVPLALPDVRYRTAPQVRGFYQQLIEKVRALPGVSAVSATSHLPMSGQDSRIGINPEGLEPNPQEPRRAHWRVINPDYFRTLKIPLLEGRLPTTQDTQEGAPPVLLLNRAAAERYWPNQSPVGKRLRLGGAEEWREIIGVVGNVKHWGLEKNVNPEMYLPGFYRSVTLLVRTEGDPVGLTNAIRAQVRELDRELQ